jgi:hypothetical protein
MHLPWRRNVAPYTVGNRKRSHTHFLLGTGGTQKKEEDWQKKKKKTITAKIHFIPYQSGRCMNTHLKRTCSFIPTQIKIKILPTKISTTSFQSMPILQILTTHSVKACVNTHTRTHIHTHTSYTHTAHAAYTIAHSATLSNSQTQPHISVTVFFFYVTYFNLHSVNNGVFFLLWVHTTNRSQNPYYLHTEKEGRYEVFPGKPRYHFLKNQFLSFTSLYLLQSSILHSFLHRIITPPQAQQVLDNFVFFHKESDFRWIFLRLVVS